MSALLVSLLGIGGALLVSAAWAGKVVLTAALEHYTQDFLKGRARRTESEADRTEKNEADKQAQISEIREVAETALRQRDAYHSELIRLRALVIAYRGSLSEAPEIDAAVALARSEQPRLL